MASLRIFLLLVLPLFLSFCGSKLSTGRREGATTNPQTALTGLLPVTTGATLDLAQDGGKPTVLLFATQFCTACMAEHRRLVTEITTMPTSINLVTIIVSGMREDAQEFQDRFNIPWTVGWDEYMKIYGPLSPETKVPLTVIHIPGKGVVFSHYGETTRADIQQFTGVIQ